MSPTVTVDKRSAKAESTRAQVRQWVIQQTADEPIVEATELAKRAVKYFGKDATFKQSFFEESFYQMVYQIVVMTISATRIYSSPEIDPIEGDGSTASNGTKRVAPRSIFERWMEHAGDHHVLLLQMTKDDLKVAEHTRRMVGSTHIGIANWFKYLREHMRPGDEMVQDRFNPAQLEKLYAKFISGEAQ